MLTHDALKERLSYDPNTGVFSYKSPVRGRVTGATAGTVRPDGYLTIILFGKPYATSRLAWLYVYGKWPNEEIDHIDRNPSNNRIENLRDVSRSQNNCNHRVRSDSKTGVKGVHFHLASGLWHVTIRSYGKKRSVGYFKNIAEAAEASRAAEIETHGEFACQN